MFTVIINYFNLNFLFYFVRNNTNWLNLEFLRPPTDLKYVLVIKDVINNSVDIKNIINIFT